MSSSTNSTIPIISIEMLDELNRKYFDDEFGTDLKSLELNTNNMDQPVDKKYKWFDNIGSMPSFLSIFDNNSNGAIKQKENINRINSQHDDIIFSEAINFFHDTKKKLSDPLSIFITILISIFILLVN